MNLQSTPPGKDPQLWQLAQRRASFKKHLATYVIINGFLWLIWLFGNREDQNSGLPWPAWSSLGWGIGLFFHFVSAYVSSGKDAVESEYEKLVNQNKP